MRKRIILAGKAGSGKDYLAAKLKELGYIKDISFTTRPMRIGEIEGIHYNYITEEVFADMVQADGFYENVCFNGWYYGTSVESWEKSHVFISTPRGIDAVRTVDREDCFIVYLDIDENIRRERISQRSDADSVDRRIEADRKDFENFVDFDLRITNPTFTVENILLLWEKSQPFQSNHV
jgi:guanylate kinase